MVRRYQLKIIWHWTIARQYITWYQNTTGPCQSLRYSTKNTCTYNKCYFRLLVLALITISHPWLPNVLCHPIHCFEVTRNQVSVASITVLPVSTYSSTSNNSSLEHTLVLNSYFVQSATYSPWREFATNFYFLLPSSKLVADTLHVPSELTRG